MIVVLSASQFARTNPMMNGTGTARVLLQIRFQVRVVNGPGILGP